MGSSVERITKRPGRWQAWAGTADQMKRIGSLMEKLVARRRDDLVTQYLEEHPPPADEEEAARRRPEFFPFVAYEGKAEADLEDIRKGCDVRVSLTDRSSDEATGSLEEIFEELDRRTYQKVVFRATSSGHSYLSKEKLKVEMARDTENRASL